jgi:hypothetical protein
LQHNGVFTGFNRILAALLIAQTGGNSIFNGGTVVVKRAFTRGLNLQVSHSARHQRYRHLMDVANRRLDRALTSFDSAQKLVPVGGGHAIFQRHGLVSSRAGRLGVVGQHDSAIRTPLTVGCSGSYLRCD